MQAKDSLRDYRAKRDLGRTPEPAGSRRGRRKRPRFVVHQNPVKTQPESVKSGRTIEELTADAR